ncbi:carboxypeptidase-like regulatory domain-containing protein [Halotia branconii]|uniref:Carboxypeptidase regulatory-like domain-containing protein n=1 Tax=Halotia branconii CENA392 TaxID=1539056 RepID=A0AAJ6NWP0_9CYAN|nr:carboxypeptidase regulatory-like domain-containing protein [Halotia branconii]WGV27992.1 carboxypeptidase regulatory-like domain-containing protein [Halotia branconii CENA392]
MLKWELIRHQVAIAGQVTNAQTNKAIPNAEVIITKAPSAFADWLKLKSLQYGDRWNSMVERPDRTITANDGHFHFLELPEGEYTLTASVPNATRRYSKGMLTVTVPAKVEGKVIITTADMTMPTTFLQGKIFNQNEEPVLMAQVQFGYTESTFSNDQGQYSLFSIETSEIERLVLVSAQGYQPTSQSVVIKAPGTLQPPLNFILQR